MLSGCTWLIPCLRLQLHLHKLYFVNFILLNKISCDSTSEIVMNKFFGLFPTSRHLAILTLYSHLATQEMIRLDQMIITIITLQKAGLTLDRLAFRRQWVCELNIRSPLPLTLPLSQKLS